MQSFNIKEWEYRKGSFFYDVLQIKKDGGWTDFASIKTTSDAEDAKKAVEGGRISGMSETAEFRIRRQNEIEWIK